MYYLLWTDDTVAAHAVTIVGWDDHYDRSLFGENTPPGDGAFLIKNSFGKMGEDSKAGDRSLFREGYFWLSYYDATIQTPATFTGTLVEDDKYDHLYLHDYAGFTNTPYVEIKEGVFDSDRNGDGVIQKDELVYSAVGENGILAKDSGYNVQDLKTPIALLKDQLFSVVARVFGSEGGQLPLEAASGLCDSPYVKIARGQTYYTDESGNWVDVCDFKIAPELFEKQPAHSRVFKHE